MQRGVPVLLVAAVLVVYGSSLAFPFLALDDLRQIAHNPLYQPPRLANVGAWWGDWGRPPYPQPLSDTAWGGLVALSLALRGRVDPVLFHGANLALHALRALATFGLLRRVLARVRPEAPVAEHVVPAALGSLLFALHPTQVELVAWAVNLRTLLASLLATVAMALHVQAHAGRGRHLRVLAFAAFVAACLAKPSALVAPFVLLPLDVGLLRQGVRRTSLRLLPWAVMSAAGAWMLATRLQPPPHPLPVRLETASLSLLFYLWKVVLPVGLAVEYPSARWFLERDPHRLALGGVAALGIVLAHLPRRRLLATTAGMFVGGLLPVLGLVWHEHQRITLASDRYLDLALLAPALLVALAIRGRRTVAVASAVAVVLASLSVAQLRHWRDTEAVTARCFAVSPTCDMGKFAGQPVPDHREAGRDAARRP